MIRGVSRKGPKSGGMDKMGKTAEKIETNSSLEQAKKILMKKLEVSEPEALNKIKELSKSKNLDTERTSEVIIKLENLISPSWFNGKSRA
jgi:AmiR/NasT family two-component response regulator